MTRFDLAATQCEDLEQRNGLLHLLVCVDILDDHLGFAVLGDDQGFPLVRKRKVRDVAGYPRPWGTRFNTARRTFWEPLSASLKVLAWGILRSSARALGCWQVCGQT